MNIVLKQLDITINEQHSPSYELVRDNIVTREMYEKSLFSKIDRRLNQIDNLKKLRDNDYSDKEFYELVNKVYYLTYENKSVINTNILSNYNLTIRLGVNSTKKYDHYKFYTIDELYEMFNNEEILLTNINICEYDYQYYKMIYGVEREDFRLIDDDELGKTYSKLLDDFINNYNDKIIKRVRSILTKERLDSDLKRLIDFTNNEYIYLKNVDSKLNIHQLTY